jgi:hypothetical protein
MLRALTVWFCQSIFAKRIHKKEEELVQEYSTIQENEINDLVEQAMFEIYHALLESSFCCQTAPEEYGCFDGIIGGLKLYIFFEDCCRLGKDVSCS